MSEEEILINIKEMINICDSLPNEECTVHIISHDHFKAVKGLLDVYNKQQNKIASKEKQIKLMQSCDLARVIKEQEKIIMEQEKEIDKYKKQEFGNLFNGKYISKTEIRDKIKELEETWERYQEEHGYNDENYLYYMAQIKVLKEMLGE